MAISLVHMLAGTPTFSWCDSCMKSTRMHLEFHTLTHHGVTRVLTINRCTDAGHDDD